MFITETVRLYDFAKHLYEEIVLFDDVHLNALNLMTRVVELKHQRETKIRKNIESFAILMNCSFGLTANLCVFKKNCHKMMKKIYKITG
jgi:hypothetical protein